MEKSSAHANDNCPVTNLLAQLWSCQMNADVQSETSMKQMTRKKTKNKTRTYECEISCNQNWWPGQPRMPRLACSQILSDSPFQSCMRVNPDLPKDARALCGRLCPREDPDLPKDARALWGRLYQRECPEGRRSYVSESASSFKKSSLKSAGL